MSGSLASWWRVSLHVCVHKNKREVVDDTASVMARLLPHLTHRAAVGRRTDPSLPTHPSPRIQSVRAPAHAVARTHKCSE